MDGAGPVVDVPDGWSLDPATAAAIIAHKTASPAAAPVAAPTAAASTVPATAEPPMPHNVDMPPGWTLDPNAQQFVSSGAGARPPKAIIDDPKYGASNLMIARASLAPDVNDQIKRYADHFGVDTNQFGVVNGEIVRWLPQENAYAKVVPTIGAGTGVLDKAARTLPQSASGLGPALPQAAGTAAGALSAPLGLPSVGIAAGAAGVTDFARQATDRWLAGEPLNTDWLNVGGQAALAAVGQGVGVGAAKLLTSNPLSVGTYDRLKAIDPRVQQAATDLEADAKARGVDLSAGQSTGLSSVMQQERMLGRFPETTDTVFNFTKNQRQVQVPQAINDEITKLSPATGEAAVGQFRDAADTVLGAALKDRSAQAQTSYGTALNKPPFWTDQTYTSPVAGRPDFTLDDLMQSPSMQPAIARARQLSLENRAGDLTVPTYENGKAVARDVVPGWRDWDYIKQGLDAEISGPGTKPPEQGGGLNAWGNAVSKTRKELLSVLDPQNPDWVAARLQYGSASGTVNEMLDGGLGILKQLKDAQPLDRVAVVRRIFDAGNLTPEEIGRMRGSFYLGGQKDSWNTGVAAWLSDKLADSTKAAGLNGNLPGQFYKSVWLDPRQKAILQSALAGDPTRAQGISKLMDVVAASARGLPEGSPTITDGMQLANWGKPMGAGVRFLSKATSLNTYAEIGQSLLEDLPQYLNSTPNANIKLAKALLGGDTAAQLRQLALLSPTSQRGIALASDILYGAMGLKTRAAVAPPADFAAPAAPRPQGPSAGQ